MSRRKKNKKADTMNENEENNEIVVNFTPPTPCEHIVIDNIVDLGEEQSEDLPAVDESPEIQEKAPETPKKELVVPKIVETPKNVVTPEEIHLVALKSLMERYDSFTKKEQGIIKRRINAKFVELAAAGGLEAKTLRDIANLILTSVK